MQSKSMPNSVTAEYVEEIVKNPFIIPHLAFLFNLAQKRSQMHQAIQCKMDLINSLLEVES
jgi:hypothetical protein